MSGPRIGEVWRDLDILNSVDIRTGSLVDVAPRLVVVLDIDGDRALVKGVRSKRPGLETFVKVEAFHNDARRSRGFTRERA